MNNFYKITIKAKSNSKNKEGFWFENNKRLNEYDIELFKVILTR